MPDLKAIPHFKTEDEEREFWAIHDSMDYVDWSKGVTVNGDSTAPEWLVDYFRMVEQWADAFDRDAVHLTQEEYDAQFNDPQLAGLEGL